MFIQKGFYPQQTGVASEKQAAENHRKKQILISEFQVLQIVDTFNRESFGSGYELEYSIKDGFRMLSGLGGEQEAADEQFVIAEKIAIEIIGNEYTDLGFSDVNGKRPFSIAQSRIGTP